MNEPNPIGYVKSGPLFHLGYGYIYPHSGIEANIPIYTHHPDDTALLRQALEALKYYVSMANVDHSEPLIVTAIKTRLGETWEPNI